MLGDGREHVEIVHVVPPHANGFDGVVTSDEVLDFMMTGAQENVQQARDRVGERHPDLPVVTRVEPGHPVDVLVAASDAILVVIGARGVGPLRAMLGGSVSDALLTHARGQVVVVPEDVVAGDTPHFLVGVDERASENPAYDYAVQLARLENAVVRTVHAIVPTVVQPMVHVGRIPETTPADVVGATDDIERASESHDVDVIAETFHASAIGTLTEQSDAADLLIVSSRDRGRLAGLVLGSTSRTVAQKSACPVLVVRG